MGQYLQSFAEGTELDHQCIRKTFAEIASGLVGFGAVDKPPGRRAAYQDTLGPGETGSMRQSMLTMYSCGLVGRAILRLAGVRHRRLAPPYRVGMAVSDLSVIGIEHGARRSGGPGDWPHLGDIACIGEAGPARPKQQTPEAMGAYQAARARWLADWGGEAHVFCVTERDESMYRSVDGGQQDEQLGGMCIEAKERSYSIRRDRLWIGGRRLNFFLSCVALKFDPDAQWILPQRLPVG